jgi:hypothetical protein
VIWYVENLKRFKQEREALELLASTEGWLTPLKWRVDDEFRVTWDADIAVPAGNRPVSLRYPNHFPHSPPLVLPRGDMTRWSIHQYGPGGELCLEYGPDNWDQDITGADMIASAYRLLQGERPAPDVSAEVASRHQTTIGQDLRGTFTRFLITRALADELVNLPESMMASAQAINMYRGDSLVHLIATITMPDGRIWKDELPDAEKLGFERSVALVRWPGDARLPPTSSLTDFRAAAARYNLEFPDVKYALLVRKARVRAYFVSAEDDTVFEVSTIPPQPFTPRLDKDHAALAARKAAIVGCGSLGSKIAVSLARSGVGGFLLVDDDLFLPDNLVRHDLDWREVGTHKADSVASRIQLVNPAAVREVRKHRLGGQESSGGIESLIESLGTCDLIIDATADPSVFNYLCAAVAVAKKPMLWAEVFGGGFGGMIARHRPSNEPDPASMRRAIENWCADRGKPMQRAPNRYGGEAHSPAIADDADVTVIAGHAARLAIDLLIPRSPSIFPHSVYLIGLAEGWIFDQPFETHPIEIGPPPAAEIEEPLDTEESKAELNRIVQLFTHYKDASASDSPGGQAPSE